jgi:hypothetical protein
LQRILNSSGIFICIRVAAGLQWVKPVVMDNTANMPMVITKKDLQTGGAGRKSPKGPCQWWARHQMGIVEHRLKHKINGGMRQSRLFI